MNKKLRTTNKNSNILFSTILVVSLFSSSHISLAYSPTTTHAGLTDQIVDFYNFTFDTKITEEQRKLIIQGSIDEDNPSPRVVNHFYDPINNKGVKNGRPAKDWAVDTSTLNTYTWQNGMKAYTEGNTEKTYLILGHIIHLLEDMAVPDHTRNDPHINLGWTSFNTSRSPFEDWADENKNKNTLKGLANTYIQSGYKPKSFSNLGEYFDFLANYSNRNFFSKDTIVNSLYQYPEPKIIKSVGVYGYGKDNLTGDTFKLLILSKDGSGKNIFLLSDENDTSILSEYFSRLSKQAILSGAGVIDLFLKEAEIAKKEYLTAEQAREQERLKRKEKITTFISTPQGIDWFIKGAGVVSDMMMLGTRSFFNTLGSTVRIPINTVKAGSQATWDGTKIIVSSAGTVGALAVVNLQNFIETTGTAFGEGVAHHFLLPTVNVFKNTGEFIGVKAVLPTTRFVSRFIKDSPVHVTPPSQESVSLHASPSTSVRLDLDRPIAKELISISEKTDVVKEENKQDEVKKETEKEQKKETKTQPEKKSEPTKKEEQKIEPKDEPKIESTQPKTDNPSTPEPAKQVVVKPSLPPSPPIFLLIPGSSAPVSTTVSTSVTSIETSVKTEEKKEVPPVISLFTATSASQKKEDPVNLTVV